MADARQDENWRQTANVLAMLLNVNRAKKTDKWFTARDFPRAAKRQKASPPPKADITILKAVFLDRKGRGT